MDSSRQLSIVGETLLKVLAVADHLDSFVGEAVGAVGLPVPEIALDEVHHPWGFQEWAFLFVFYFDDRFSTLYES